MISGIRCRDKTSGLLERRGEERSELGGTDSLRAGEPTCSWSCSNYRSFAREINLINKSILYADIL